MKRRFWILPLIGKMCAVCEVRLFITPFNLDAKMTSTRDCVQAFLYGSMGVAFFAKLGFSKKTRLVVKKRFKYIAEAYLY